MNEQSLKLSFIAKSYINKNLQLKKSVLNNYTLLKREKQQIWYLLNIYLN